MQEGFGPKRDGPAIDIDATFRAESPGEVTALDIAVKHFPRQVLAFDEFGCALREPPAQSCAECRTGFLIDLYQRGGAGEGRQRKQCNRGSGQDRTYSCIM